MLSAKFAGLPLLVWMLIVIPAFFIFLVAIGGDSVVSGPDQQVDPVSEVPIPPAAVTAGPTPTTVPTCSEASSVSWIDAARYENVRVAFVGPVSEARQQGDSAELLIGFGAAEPVSVQILEPALRQFPGPASQVFANKTVCVRGVVQRIDGRLRVIIDNAADLAVIR